MIIILFILFYFILFYSICEEVIPFHNAYNLPKYSKDKYNMNKVKLQFNNYTFIYILSK